ncbi:MAG: hypothetical protein WC788_09055 [Candidatus Paceibacterota bacterium]|jgi:myosin heavy subunit
MYSTNILSILDNLEKKAFFELDDIESTFLESHGLVKTVSFYEYMAMQDEAKKLPGILESFNRKMIRKKESEKVINDLERKLTSKWHKMTTSKQKLSEEEASLRSEKPKLAALASETEKIGTEKERLEKIKAETAGYSKTSGGYAMLLDKGKERLKQLRVGSSRLENVLFESFEQELEKINQEIDARYKRFRSMHELLIKEGFNNTRKVIHFAISLSALPDDEENIYRRAGVINDYLYNKGWTSYQRLRIASLVAVQEGDIDKLRDELGEILTLMVDDGHSKSYSTWSEAALIMKIRENSPIEKYQRFNRMREEFFKKGWQIGSAATCFISANMAQMEGQETEIASQVDALEKNIISKGRTDSVESGITAMILMNARGSVSERGDRFNETFETMVRKGWEEDTSNYAAAAIVSILPGTIEENILLLDEVRKRLEKDGFTSELTNRAAVIVAGGMKELFRQDSISGINCTSASSSGCTDFAGFNMSGAVMFDILDNGRLDLSPGFFIGGLLR